MIVEKERAVILNESEMTSMTCIDFIFNFCESIGALATATTAFLMIRANKRLDSRIKNLEDMQIDALYRPNLRVNSYGTTGKGLSVTIVNLGEDIVIERFESIPAEWIDNESTKRWTPLPVYKNSDPVVIPLFGKMEMFKEGTIILTATDKLNRRFLVSLSSVNNKFMVSRIESFQ